ncbi:MAG: hypothetical protein CBARDMAM_5959, partial [uncultured Caballeronia sp.]
MKTVICEQPGSLVLIDRPSPEPGIDDVLIRIKRVGVSESQPSPPLIEGVVDYSRTWSPFEEWFAAERMIAHVISS